MIKAVFDGKKISVSIPLKALKTMMHASPNMEFEHKGETAYPVITDEATFANEVVAALNREEEDGTNCLHLAFDKAFEDISENGAEGIVFPGDDEYETE